MTTSEAAKTVPYDALCAAVGRDAASAMVHGGQNTTHERYLQALVRAFPQIPWFDLAFGYLRIDSPFEGALYELMRERCLPPSSMARILGVSSEWMRSVVRGDWYSDPTSEIVIGLTQVDPGRDWIGLAAQNARRVHLKVPRKVPVDHPIRAQMAELVRAVQSFERRPLEGTQGENT